jgi:plasmid stabilization system protein ParE
VTVRLTPEAEADLTEAYAWYRERAVSLGAEFLLSFEAVIAVLSAIPKPTRRCTAAFAEH